MYDAFQINHITSIISYQDLNPDWNHFQIWYSDSIKQITNDRIKIIILAHQIVGSRDAEKWYISYDDQSNR